MHPGHDQTGSTQLSDASCRSRFARAGGILVPKMLFRFERRNCSEVARTLLISAVVSRLSVLADVGRTIAPPNRMIVKHS